MSVPSSQMNAKVFINYRREDTAPYAGRLYDRLTAHFGEDHVFIDIDQIEPGEDFVEAINRKVSACDIAIVAIGPNWLRPIDASGKRRLDDEEDFVRMEIVAVLQREIRVIPVLLGGAQMPGRHDLPEALAPLSRRNAIELSETRFHADVDRLIEAIERSFEVAQPDWSSERSQQRSVATPKESTTPVKSSQTTPTTPKIPSTSLFSGLRESKVWITERRVLVSAILLLLGLAAFLIWPGHQKAAKQGNQPAIASLETDQGNAATQNNLGRRYYNGEGVPRDLGKAAELFQKAAEQGNADSQNNLGRLYYNGEGVPRDLGKAAELFQKAAEQGNADAQRALARLFVRGEGVPRDLGKAAELYQKAAYQGNVDAQFSLALLYEKGEGVPKDLGKAAELYQTAANQGDAEAQFNLGLLYEKGEGVPEDSAKAGELYHQAANQGFEQAVLQLNNLSDASIVSLRNFELAFIDEFAVPGKRFNAAAFEAKVSEGNAKFQQTIADEKLTERRPVLVDLKAQFDAAAAHLKSKASRGKLTPALATEMKKDVNEFYDHALGR
jgi:hypothetical protein